MIRCLLMPLLLVPPGLGPSREDLGRSARALLSDRCFACHGPDAAARRGGLRLDRSADWSAGVVVSGQPAASELVRRIRASDPETRMPPPESRLALTDDEVALLERWIAAGAPLPAHWAFEPPVAAPPPSTSRSDWVRDPLDAFVLARLEGEGLAPAPEADRATWLRRASYVLTGLPPTLAELDAFLTDEDPRAYLRQVERLLASPRYGERMATHWLDLARYSDTYGYQSDVYRDVWPWRDWVVEAFNTNLAFDAFATWQLAGDLVPGAAREARLATAFNRLHRQTNEGGSLPEEWRAEYVADRVATFGTAFLGLTLECARCHDHKFDPLTTREFYGLSAFFDNIDELGVYPHFNSGVPTPALDLPTPDQEEELARHGAAVAEREAALAAFASGPRRGFDDWLEALDPSASSPGLRARFAMDEPSGARLINAVTAANPGKLDAALGRTDGVRGGGVELTGDHAATFAKVGEVRRWASFTVGLWLLAPVAPERAVLLHRSRAWLDGVGRGWQLMLEDGRLTAALVHSWPEDAAAVRAREPLPLGRWVHVALTYDGSSRAAGLALYIDGRLAPAEVQQDRLTRQIVGGGESALVLGARFRDRGFAGGRVDELVWFDRALAPLEVLRLADAAAWPAAVSAARAGDPTTRTALRALHAATADTELAEARRALTTARRARDQARDDVRQILTMRERARRRATRVLRRGRYDDPGERVDPGVPAALPSLPPPLDGGPPDRLALARWLTAPDHPLFARVAVNRLWQLCFGAGLVVTPEDFGVQGAPPSHPALLDHLAREFVASGYDQKALLARIALSATFRQSSRVEPAARVADPDARLLSRFPSRRLEAEMLRDGALYAAGLLVERRGGPPVKPYQPPGLWKEKSGAVYVADEGEGLWRRSLYTYWKRTSPPPAMMTFDAAKRDVCRARRGRTTTPLQALVLWNDPQWVEAARGLAERALLEGGEGRAAQLAFAFRVVTARPPDAAEAALLAELAAALEAHYVADPDGAQALLMVGARPVPDTVDAAALAALTLVASDLFSHHAALTLR